MRKWEEFLDDARNLGVDTFSVRHPTPMFVLLAVDTQVDNLGPERFKTTYTKTASLSQALRGAAAKPATGTADDNEPVTVGAVIAVQKRVGNAYPNRISIGRTKTNDITIAWPLISKFHAYVTLADNGAFSITDAGATNGTVLGGATLVAGIETPLADKAMLRLGPYRFTFLVPKSFHEMLLNPPGELRHGR